MQFSREPAEMLAFTFTRPQLAAAAEAVRTVSRAEIEKVLARENAAAGEMLEAFGGEEYLEKNNVEFARPLADASGLKNLVSKLSSFRLNMLILGSDEARLMGTALRLALERNPGNRDLEGAYSHYMKVNSEKAESMLRGLAGHLDKNKGAD